MLIALNGRLGAGKDTAADRIEAIFAPEREVKRLTFAGPLKRSVCALLGVTLQELEDMKLDPNPTVKVKIPSMEFPNSYIVRSLTGRQFLERYGTEAHRDVFGDNFWLDQAIPRDPFLLEHHMWVITDCRFVNEAERVQELGGIVIEIVGPNGREGNGHPSDTPLPDHLIDAVIDNTVHDDNFAHLDTQLRTVLSTIWRLSAS